MTDPDDTLPAPPWSSEISLGVFENVEIPRRLLEGPVFSGLSAEAFAAQLRLMAFAWHENPAGSLPTDTATLARIAGVSHEAWGPLGLEALGAWTYCRDGRLYLEPWGAVIENAWSRRTKIKGSNANRQARSRMRSELKGIGVPNVDGIEAVRIDELVAVFRNRGIHEARGAARAEQLAILAGEAGLLPDHLGRGDVRLATKFRPITGGAGG